MATPAQIGEVDAGLFRQEPEAAQDRAVPAPTAHWSPALRVAFRFCFVYFTVYSLNNQIIGGLLDFPKVDLPDLSIHWPLRQASLWAAAYVFRVKHPLVYTETGSGDRAVTLAWLGSSDCECGSHLFFFGSRP